MNNMGRYTYIYIYTYTYTNIQLHIPARHSAGAADALRHPQRRGHAQLVPSQAGQRWEAFTGFRTHTLFLSLFFSLSLDKFSIL